MQYDPSISDLADRTPVKLKSFCERLLQNFPKEVVKILDTSDFSSSYIWCTRDFDLLPSFHKENVVLIGDAAHLALPFTSAGTTNAIVDAETLTQCLDDAQDYRSAFENYYTIRADEVAKHIQLGRKLSDIFLNPKKTDDNKIPLPLVPAKKPPIRSPKPKYQS